MTNAELSTNNILTIDGRAVGQVLAVTASGNVQNPTAHRAQVATQFRPIVAPATLGDAIRLDMPVYVSASPSDRQINPALIAAIADRATA